MLVSNTTIEQMNSALDIINQRYNNNIIWNREPELVGKKLRFTLRVKNSKGLGAKISYTSVPWGGKPRRSTSACWHVHGHFFDALLDINPSAVIQTNIKCESIPIYKDEAGTVCNNWQDWNIGSVMYYIPYSTSCECGD
jgi:hypothetical protein